MVLWFRSSVVWPHFCRRPSICHQSFLETCCKNLKCGHSARDKGSGCTVLSLLICSIALAAVLQIILIIHVSLYLFKHIYQSNLMFKLLL